MAVPSLLTDMYPCDLDLASNRQRAGCFAPASAHAPLQTTGAGLPALTPPNSFIHSEQFHFISIFPAHPPFFPGFSSEERHFDPPSTVTATATTSFTPRKSERSGVALCSLANVHSARPEHYSPSPTTQSQSQSQSQSPTAPLSLSLQAPAAPTHSFGHQTPWVPQPTGSFLFQPSASPSYLHPLGDADYDYFAIARSAGSPSPGPSNISGSPTLGERTPPTSQAALPTKLLASLSLERQRIVKDADPAHQPAIMEILTSYDFHERGDIPAEKLQAFYISVPHVRTEGDKQGSRGGAAGYTCRWHACPQAEADRPIKRRDHMLNHIRGHFGVKPFGCKFGNGVNLPRWCVYTHHHHAKLRSPSSLSPQHGPFPASR